MILSRMKRGAFLILTPVKIIAKRNPAWTQTKITSQVISQIPIRRILSPQGWNSGQKPPKTETIGFFQVLLTFRDSHPLPYTFPNSSQSGQIFLVFFNCLTHRALQNMLSSVVFGPFFKFTRLRVPSNEPLGQKFSPRQRTSKGAKFISR